MNRTIATILAALALIFTTIPAAGATDDHSPDDSTQPFIMITIDTPPSELVAVVTDLSAELETTKTSLVAATAATAAARDEKVRLVRKVDRQRAKIAELRAKLRRARR